MAEARAVPLAQAPTEPRAQRVSTSFRRGLILVPPLALALLEVFHPQPDETLAAVMDVATWFLTFHTIQLALIGLVGLSVLLLADELGHAHSWAVRLGLGVFLVFYSAYDAVAGIATGLALRTARDLPPAQQDGIWAAVKDWPGFDPVPFSINIVGTLGWVVALGALALAARRAGAPRTQWVFIGLAALFLMGGHPFPFGTLAFGSLFLAAVFVDRAAHRRSSTARA
jgi:hypothetical protein